MTKKDTILRAMQSGDRLTSFKAAAYGTLRLAAVVHALRAQGYVIDVEYKEDAAGTKFAEYSMPSNSELTRRFGRPLAA